MQSVCKHKYLIFYNIQSVNCFLKGLYENFSFHGLIIISVILTRAFEIKIMHMLIKMMHRYDACADQTEVYANQNDVHAHQNDVHADQNDPHANQMIYI